MNKKSTYEQTPPLHERPFFSSHSMLVEHVPPLFVLFTKIKKFKKMKN